MDKIKDQLIILYDEMFEKVERFSKASYNNIFLEAFRKYEDFVEDIADLLENTVKEERKNVIDDIAQVLPVYVKEKVSKLPEKEVRSLEINYNMNMAVYVLPILTYSHDNYCEKVAKRIVEVWNEMKVTSLNLSYSTYESIAGGFKKKLCYITTAVCEYQNKPDDCYELTTLRNYRDNYLINTEIGRELVDEYYNIAPGLVMMINMQLDAKEIYQNIYEEYLVPCIHYIEKDKNEECRDLYMQMVRSLQKKYLYS